MSGGVSAADGALDRGAKIVAESRQALVSEMSGLTSKLMALQPAWKGQSAVAFHKIMESWNQDTKKIVDALNDFESNLKSSQSTYTNKDDSATSGLNKHAGRLNHSS